jgi:hypothetical protein
MQTDMLKPYNDRQKHSFVCDNTRSEVNGETKHPGEPSTMLRLTGVIRRMITGHRREVLGNMTFLF